MRYIEVQLFAAAAAAAQQNLLRVELPNTGSTDAEAAAKEIAAKEITAKELLAQLAACCPPLAPLLGSCRLAVNGRYVGDDATLDPAAEIALIPPVSGG